MNKENAVKTDSQSMPLSEYPRPQLERESYICLNGYWQFDTTKIGVPCDNLTKEILVPFSPETKASGLEMVILPDDIMHYKRQFDIPENFKQDKVILHFGAVDYSCEVFINGNLAGEHAGGYLPFSFDITAFFNDDSTNEIYLKAWDPTDQGWGQRGKQVLKPKTIWYTPNSGIYQTVWLESVAKTHVKNIEITQNFEEKIVNFNLDIDDYKTGEIAVKLGDVTVAKKQLQGEKTISIKVENAEDWSPENPVLYDVIIKVDKDEVKCYFGFRKFSKEIGEDGKIRLCLNNKPYLHNGVLDQGYWQESLLSPPSEEAMIFDIEKIKGAGFNTIRKHIKIEPLRWYYHCDKIGMLVWQDFVSGGDTKYKPMVTMYLPFIGVKISDKKYKLFSRESEDGREEFIRDATGTVNLLKNTVSISTWTIFNEGWGQFDSGEITKTIKKLDPTRHIDSTSGWHDTGCGDFASSHIYFRKVKLKKDPRVLALSEFGGYSMAVPNHYDFGKPYGYKMYKDSESLEKAYQKLYEKEVLPHIKQGLSVVIYTQVSDVEVECNGIFTFDRKVQKLSNEVLLKTNQKLYEEFDKVTK